MDRRKFLGTLALAPVAPWVTKLPFIGKWFEPPCEDENWYYHKVLYYAKDRIGIRVVKVRFTVTLPPSTSMRMRYIDNAKTLS